MGGGVGVYSSFGGAAGVQEGQASTDHGDVVASQWQLAKTIPNITTSDLGQICSACSAHGTDTSPVESLRDKHEVFLRVADCMARRLQDKEVVAIWDPIACTAASVKAEGNDFWHVIGHSALREQYVLESHVFERMFETEYEELDVEEFGTDYLRSREYHHHRCKTHLILAQHRRVSNSDFYLVGDCSPGKLTVDDDAQTYILPKTVVSQSYAPYESLHRTQEFLLSRLVPIMQAKGRPWAKTTGCLARPANIGETICCIEAGEEISKQDVAESGWIIVRPAISDGGQFVLRETTFNERYHSPREIPGDEPSRNAGFKSYSCRPVHNLIYKLTAADMHLFPTQRFLPPWESSKPLVVRVGTFFAADYPTPSEVYTIPEQTLKQAYVPYDELHRNQEYMREHFLPKLVQEGITMQKVKGAFLRVAQQGEHVRTVECGRVMSECVVQDCNHWVVKADTVDGEEYVAHDSQIRSSYDMSSGKELYGPLVHLANKGFKYYKSVRAIKAYCLLDVDIESHLPTRQFWGPWDIKEPVPTERLVAGDYIVTNWTGNSLDKQEAAGAEIYPIPKATLEQTYATCPETVQAIKMALKDFLAPHLCTRLKMSHTFLEKLERSGRRIASRDLECSFSKELERPSAANMTDVVLINATDFVLLTPSHEELQYLPNFSCEVVSGRVQSVQVTRVRSSKKHKDDGLDDLHFDETCIYEVGDAENLRLPLKSTTHQMCGALRILSVKAEISRMLVPLQVIAWSPPHSHRGVPICDLLRCMQDFQCYFGSSFAEVDWYRANSALIYPRTEVAKVSYAELFTNFGPVEWVVSHVWSEKLSAVIEELEGLSTLFEARLGENWATTRVYLCVLSNCQPRIDDEMQYTLPVKCLRRTDTSRQFHVCLEGNGSPGLHVGAKLLLRRYGSASVVAMDAVNQMEFDMNLDFDLPDSAEPSIGWAEPMYSPFAQALAANHCKGVLAFLGATCGPFKRAWCLLEVLLCKMHSKILHMCMQKGHLGSDFVTFGDLDMVNRELSTIDVRNADCTRDSDKHAIMSLIERKYVMGGGGTLKATDEMNSDIRRFVEKLIQDYANRLSIVDLD